MSGSEDRDFRHILVEDTYVVWLSGVNRFLQLKEPAYFVFKAWASGKESVDIAMECVARYGLPPGEAMRFTKEITVEMEKLYLLHRKDAKTQRKLGGSPRLLSAPLRIDSIVLPQRCAEEALSIAEINPIRHPMDYVSPISSCYCMINGIIICFIYAEPGLEELFRPMFMQFETETKCMGHGAQSMEHGAWGRGYATPVPGLNEFLNSSILNKKSDESLRRSEIFVEKCPPPTQDTQIEMPGLLENRTYGDENDRQEVVVENENRIVFSRVDGNYAFSVNEQETQTFGANDIEHFQGAVLMEVLNILHGKTREDWMGVIHASAVSDGKVALLFVGASGSGKSTLAALMAAHGFQLLSDDFVPVALDTPEVYPLPAAISIKKNAITFLKDYFPSLSDDNARTTEDANGEVFLPLPEGSLISSPVIAKAIVFVQYNPEVKFHLARESNLNAMNTLLKQSWIANNSYAAERFLNWYFGLPVYTLTYSDGEKMVREIKLIFDDVNDS